MKLLISKTCENCKPVKNINKRYPQIKKYYVKDGIVKIDRKVFDVGKELPGLPALITDKVVYVGAKKILEFIKTLEAGEK